MNTQIASQGRGSGYLAQDWGERAGFGSHKGERFLMGALDEVYIYTSALSQTQIRKLACVCEDSKGEYSRENIEQYSIVGDSPGLV